MASDAALIAELQRRLRVPRSATPKAELIAIALRLARDPLLDPSVGTFWKDAGVTSNDSRSRIKTFAKRMIEEQHLDAALRALTQPAAEQPWQALFGLSETLLVEQRWIDEHVPGVSLTTVEPLVRSECGAFATRVVRAQSTDSSEALHAEVTYDLPPVEGENDEDCRRRRDMHRKREETALRSLDAVAVAAFRAKRALQRQDLRGRDAEVVDVLDRLIGAVERSVEREANAWRCPDGCALGSVHCARLAWRKRCVPCLRTNTLWIEEHTYYGSSGRAFGDEKQRQMRCLEPDYHEAFQVTDEMREDFLAMWDGIVEPQLFWEPWLCTRTCEWLGLSDHSRHPAPDRCGWDHRPVGPTACARRACDGCCFCRGKPLPPVRLLVTDQHAKGHLHSTKRWLTIGELHDHVQRLAQPSRRPPLQPIPVYLLNRLGDEPDEDVNHDGRVVRVPGDVRDHVTADELSSWAELLAPKSIELQVLQGSEASAAEDASCRAHLAPQKALRAERTARWMQLAAWTRQVRFESQVGCGLRVRQPQAVSSTVPDFSTVKSAVRVGDIVYAGQQVKGGRFTQHGVGVVTRIHRVMGFDEGCRTGEVDVVVWDAAKGELNKGVQHHVSESILSLLPPCCGEGASCPHLQATRQWPNGDSMSSSDLRKLARVPFQFNARFSRPSPCRKRAITDDDRAAMKRMRATYMPSFLKHETPRTMIRRHGAARMEKVYADLCGGLSDPLWLCDPHRHMTTL